MGYMILNHLMSLSLTTLLNALLLRTTLIMMKPELALNFYEIMGCTKHVRHAIQCSLIGRNIVNHGCMYFYYDVLKVVSLFVLFMVMVCNMQTLLDAVLNPSIKLTALMQLFLPISIMFRFGNLNSIVAAYVHSFVHGRAGRAFLCKL